MKLNSLDHVVFAVHNLEAAAADWKRVFGLDVSERLQPASIQASIGLMRIASSSAFLELAQPATPSGPVADALEERGEGMLSISIAVDDIDAAVAEIRAGGADISDVVEGALPNTRVARFSPDATHGVRLQLIQRGG